MMAETQRAGQRTKLPPLSAESASGTLKVDKRDSTLKVDSATKLQVQTETVDPPKETHDETKDKVGLMQRFVMDRLDLTQVGSNSSPRRRRSVSSDAVFGLMEMKFSPQNKVVKAMKSLSSPKTRQRRHTFNGATMCAWTKDPESSKEVYDEGRSEARAKAMAELMQSSQEVRRKSRDVSSMAQDIRRKQGEIDKAIVVLDQKTAKDRWRLAMNAVKLKVRLTGGMRKDGRRISITDSVHPCG
jgi:hypothetical protein